MLDLVGVLVLDLVSVLDLALGGVLDLDLVGVLGLDLGGVLGLDLGAFSVSISAAFSFATFRVSAESPTTCDLPRWPEPLLELNVEQPPTLDVCRG